MAVERVNICKNGIKSISRWDAILYYAPAFSYLYILSSIAASLVLGSYLYICVNWFNLHYDEAFSSLRIADYKAFTRFHVKRNGDLEVFTLAVDKVRNQPPIPVQLLKFTNQKHSNKFLDNQSI